MKLLKFVKRQLLRSKIFIQSLRENKHTKQNYENVSMNDEPMFFDELFKDECDHSSERTYVEDLKFRVFFEKRNLI